MTNIRYAPVTEIMGDIFSRKKGHYFQFLISSLTYCCAPFLSSIDAQKPKMITWSHMVKQSAVSPPVQFFCQISPMLSFFNFPIRACHSHPSFVFVCAEKDWLLVAAGGSCCDLAPPISCILILHYILDHIYIILCIIYHILLYSYLPIAGRTIMTDLAEYHQLGVGSFFILEQCLLKISISKHFQVVVDESLYEKIDFDLHG